MCVLPNDNDVGVSYLSASSSCKANTSRFFSAAKITTDEVARLFRVVPQSIRAALCRKGHYLGLRPLKLPNGKLLWDAFEVGNLLSGGGAEWRDAMIEAVPAANDPHAEVQTFTYPSQSFLPGRVLARLLTGRRYTHNDAQRELGYSGLTDSVLKLRKAGWPVMMAVEAVSTSDNGGLAEIGIYYLTDETIARAGESGQRYAADCLRRESERRAA